MNPCPSEERLRRFLDKQLADDQSAAVETHAEACPACQAALLRLSGDVAGLDWRRLRAPGPEPVPESRLDLVRRLEQTAPWEAGPDPEAGAEPLAFLGPPTAKGPLGRLDGLHVRQELGRGRFGVVYEAVDELDRLVAVKVLKPEWAADPRERSRFEQEARKAAAVRHDHIVTVHRVGQAPGSALPYLVMEYLAGETLAARLRRQGILPPQEAAEVVRQVALGLAAAHAGGLVHRDVKPSNIMLEAGSGRAKVTDFGLARATEAESVASQSGAVVGTPAYVSPEQVTAPGKVDGRSDVYSLGVVLYEALTGERPFRGLPHLVLNQVVNDPPRPPRKLNDAVPRDLETICLKCLHKEPQRRYGSAVALAEDLRHWQKGEPIHARPVGRPERVARWCRRNPVLATVSGLAAMALVALTTVSLQWAVREQIHVQELRKSLSEAEYRVAENYLDHAVVLCDRGDVSAGLLWLARALEKAPPEADRLQRVIRTQLSWWGTQVNPLRGCYDNPVPITAAALSPDGQTAWVAGADKRIRRWDFKENKSIEPPLALEARVRAVVWRPDGKIVLTVRDDDTAQCWDAATGNDTGDWFGQKIRSAAWGGPGGKTLVTGGPDGKVVLWTDGNEMMGRTIFAVPSPVKAVAVCPNGNTILVGWDKIVGQRAQGYAQFWDAARGQALCDPLALRGRVMALTFNPDGQTALIVTDQWSQLWDVRTTKPLDKGLHKAFNEAAAFSPDGRLCLTGGHDRSARLWDTATGSPEGASFIHQASVQTVAFSSDGRTIMTAGSDGAVRIWQVAANRPRARVLRHQGFVRSASFSSDNKLVLTASWDTTARIWDVGTGESKVLSHVKPVPRPVVASTFSPDGQMLLTLVWGSEVRLWDTTSGEPLGEPLDHSPGRVSKAVISPDGRTVLTGCAVDGSVRFWDVRTRAARGSFRGTHKGSVMAAAFSLDGRTACTGDEEGTACLWDVDKGQSRAQLKHEDAVLDIAFSPNGRFLLTGSRDRRARLWDLASGAQPQLGAELWHGDAVRAVAFSPDGKTALTGSEDGTARLWDTATGKPVGQPLVHQNHVVAVAFSADGRTALTGSFDWTARLWDTVTGKPLGPPLRHDGRIWAASFRSDGCMAVTAGDDNTARLWDVPAHAPGTPAEIALRTEIDTGLRLDHNDTLHVLDAASWQQRRGVRR
jgi:WD40 repeat protein